MNNYILQFENQNNQNHAKKYFDSFNYLILFPCF